MRRLTRGFRYGEKGFTLIELLVVIAILGIIAAVVVPNFSNFIGSGQDEACEIEARMVTTATIAYLTENGSCPSAIGDLDDYFEDPGDIQGAYSWDGDCNVTQTSCPASGE